MQGKAGQQYMRRLIFALSAYALILFAALSFVERIENDLLRLLVACTPVIPVAVVTWAIMDFVDKIDELQRQVQLEGFAFSFAITGIVTMILGFAEVAGFETLNLLWVFPMLMAFWGIGVARANRKYN